MCLNLGSMATATSHPAASLRLKLDLPSHVLAELERQAEDLQLEIEELISNRLCACVSHSSTKPLYVDDENRRQIEAIMGRNLSSVDDLKRELRKAVSFRVDAVTVALPQEVRMRLASRHLDKSMPYEQYVAQIVRKMLMEHVGR